MSGPETEAAYTTTWKLSPTARPRPDFAGRVLVEGAPDAVMQSALVQRVYLGIDVQ